MKQNTIRYIINFILFICIAFFNTQLIPFLKSVGYDVKERAIILAMNALFSIVLQIVFGFLCDRYQSMKKFFYIAYALFLGFGILLFYTQKEIFFLHLMASSMMASMVKVLTALIETWMLYLAKDQYGKYRAMGALGLCLGSPIIGIVIDNYSYTGVIFACLIVSILTLISAYFCDEIKYQDRIDFKEMIALVKNKPYMYIVSIYFFIYMVGTADQYAVIDKMMELKAGAFVIGIKWAVQSLLEIPFFLYASKLLKKFSPYTLLKVGIVMYGVKFMFYGLSPTPFWIILATTLQIVTLPIIAYTSKIILADICPKLKASSQMLAMAIFIGGSAFVTPLITSCFVEQFGYDITLYIWGAFAVLPFLLLLFKKRVLKQ
ncbi:MAG: MFS transporter [Erysipelotrichia bacterium]|nr:MFS transporter [Erysipelotrichia bacterium]NCC54418.1 MFS transporter [Erysipelotrichia bacterium]